MKYTVKPSEVEAFRHTRMNTRGGVWPEWLVAAWNYYDNTGVGSFFSRIIEWEGDKQNTSQYYVVDKHGETIEVGYGDYIIHDENGDLSVCLKKDFNYVPVE